MTGMGHRIARPKLALVVPLALLLPVSAAFADPGKHLATGLGPLPSGSGVAAVVDGAEGAEYEGISWGSIVLSPDGEHVVYTIRRKVRGRAAALPSVPSTRPRDARPWLLPCH
jgi:hypothetical protein